jgi:hypothetical protein
MKTANLWSIILVIIALMFALLPAWPAAAAETAGGKSVAEFRQIANDPLHGETWLIGWSAGATAALTAAGVVCARPFTVAELSAYLRYAAPGHYNMRQALVAYANQNGCTFGEEAIQPTYR